MIATGVVRWSIAGPSGDARDDPRFADAQPRPPVASSPPSTRTVSPVIQDAASETRKPTSPATSYGVPSRPSGYAAATSSSRPV
jgi:hypothetical protein